MKFNVNRINKQLTTNNIKDILFSLNSDIYKENDEQIIFYSACHNAEPCEHGHKAKLYYYKQSKSFTCYVCGESFDVYDLVKKIVLYLETNGLFLSVLNMFVKSQTFHLNITEKLKKILISTTGKVVC